MSRFLKIAGPLAVTCLLPVLALRAQQPPPTAAGEQPAAKAAAKSASFEDVEQPDRADQGRRAEAVAGHGDLELPHRRDRPPADRLTQHEAGQRVDA